MRENTYLLLVIYSELSLPPRKEKIEFPFRKQPTVEDSSIDFTHCDR